LTAGKQPGSRATLANRRAHTVVAGGVLTLAIAAALLVAAPLAAHSSAIPPGNLVQNPGAEDSPGTDVATVVKPTGWVTTGNLSAWTYAPAEGDKPTKAFAATIGGGKNFFAGGPGDNSGKQTTHTATQTIDVSGAATEIDAGQAGATLTAFIGAYTVAKDIATVTARFLDAAGTQIGSVRVGPVSIDDRKRLTVLLKRTAQANLPPKTRSMAVVITVTADGNGAHHAYVDNISLTLGKAATPAAGKPTLTASCSGKTLVAKVKPAPGSPVTSVTFHVNGKKVVTDKKAPFTVRLATSGLPASLRVGARVLASGKTVALTKTIRRCGSTP
jgi:hypothetical protein